MPESERRALPIGWILATIATVLVVGAVVAGITAYRHLFTSQIPGVFVIMQIPTPFGTVILERDDVSFQRPPKFSKPGIEEVQKHIETVMKSQRFSLEVYTDSDESTRFALTPVNSGIHLRFALDPRLHPGVELQLRSLFEEIGESPARFELKRSGITLLEYRVDGSPEEISRVVERILLEAYGVAPDAGLYFQIDD